jgi:hypothetical protein
MVEVDLAAVVVTSVKAKPLVRLNNKTKLIEIDNLVEQPVFENYLKVKLMISMLGFVEESKKLYLMVKVKRHDEPVDVQLIFHFYLVDDLLVFHSVLEL